MKICVCRNDYVTGSESDTVSNHVSSPFHCVNMASVAEPGQGLGLEGPRLRRAQGLLQAALGLHALALGPPRVRSTSLRENTTLVLAETL